MSPGLPVLRGQPSRRKAFRQKVVDNPPQHGRMGRMCCHVFPPWAASAGGFGMRLEEWRSGSRRTGAQPPRRCSHRRSASASRVGHGLLRLRWLIGCGHQKRDHFLRGEPAWCSRAVATFAGVLLSRSKSSPSCRSASDSPHPSAGLGTNDKLVAISATRPISSLVARRRITRWQFVAV